MSHLVPVLELNPRASDEILSLRGGQPVSSVLEPHAGPDPCAGPRSIFVSYCHEDSYVVDWLQKAYQALGDDYIRDIEVLRSGEVWYEELFAEIRDADIFQLCWSYAAQRSKYVRQEWQYAHSLQKQQFIRPMYWQKPMPVPPAELCQLHFTYMPLPYIEMEGQR
jgi:hypothetical protein